MSSYAARLIPALSTVAVRRLSSKKLISTITHNSKFTGHWQGLTRVFFISQNNTRLFSNMSDSNKVVGYEEVAGYKDKPEVYLIDVREPNELQETGSIPCSINIPLGDLTPTLQNSNPDNFKNRFTRELPDKDKELVFYCKMGGRATKAMEQAIQLGFTNSKVYKGSWLDWASHQSK